MPKLTIEQLKQKKKIFKNKVKYYEKKIEQAKINKHRIGFKFYD